MSDNEYNELRFEKAVSLTFCCECKYYGYFGFCTYNGRMEAMEMDDYCSKGESEE